MNPFRRILVDVDPLAPSHPALIQALAVAARYGASVTLIHVLPDVPRAARRFVTTEVEQELVDDRHSRLTALAAAAGGNVAIDVTIRRGRPAIALMQEVGRRGVDLLLRSHSSRRDAARIFGAVDMQLLRQCPCPLWLVAEDMLATPRRVVAAIDAGDPDDAEPPLNRTIADLAARVGDPEAAKVTLLYVWNAFAEELMRPRLSPEELTAYLGAAERAAEDAMAAFLASLGPGAAHVSPRLMRGVAEEAIPAFVREHGADLLVMGTVARAGLAGLLIGNTAERILQRVNVSVLAVKPPGFVSPVIVRASLDAQRR